MSALRQATSSRGEFKRASMCSSLTRFATGRSRRLAIASAAEWSSSWPEPGAQLAGAISVHGSLESAQRARAGDVTAKVLVCHGALDPHVPTTQLAAFIEDECGGNRLPADRLWRRDARLHARRRPAGAGSGISRRLRPALVPRHQGIPGRSLWPGAHDGKSGGAESLNRRPAPCRKRKPLTPDHGAREHLSAAEGQLARGKVPIIRTSVTREGREQLGR